MLDLYETQLEYHDGYGTPDLMLEVGDNLGLNVEPRDYTMTGIAWLLAKKRIMLTDEPGLGKTPQSAMAAKTPCLVACPSYLVQQWCDWLSEHMFNRDGSRQTVTNAMTGNYTQRACALKSGTQWVVINKEMLRTHEALIRDLHWETVIYDESHHLRNHSAKMSKAAANIAKDVERVYLLTATPIWKEPDDLYMQFHILQPQIFKSYYRFVDDWCYHESTRFGTMVLGLRDDKKEEIHELMRIMALGRTYKDAGRELPDVIEKTTTLDFPPEIRKHYKDVRDSYAAELEEGTLRFTHFSQVMVTLRTMTAWPGKAEAVADIVDDAKSEGTLVFCWYQDTALEVVLTLRRRGYDAEIVDGTIPVEERLRRAKAHKHIVATISSLSEGIDLSRMDTVVFAEEHWPPGSAIQALRRVRRDRQSVKENGKPIIVAHVHVKDTIDEVIHHVAQRRSATIHEVIREAL